MGNSTRSRAVLIIASKQRIRRDRGEGVFVLVQPERHIFLKPNVTRVAAENYGFDFRYASRPSWSGYANLLEFASLVRRDLRDRPRDMIDIQSFIWVLGSDEYS
jgi:hypothetical protein